jgi:uncharacterized protein (TIGR02594 family)
MASLDGTAWDPSDGHPNPTIQGWLRDIAAAYPNMAGYCNAVINDNYFAWCGVTIAYCMTKANIAPVFGSTDVNRFLFATSWLGWGTPVETPVPGDVVVFNFGAGDHHVTLFEKDNGDGTYNCHGGNQSHKLHVTKFPKSSVMGIRRPSAAGVQPQVAAGTLAPGAEGRAVTALQAALASHGFDPGGIDGEYGPLTSAAVSNFQRASNLPVTGMADLATLQKLGVSADTDRPSSDTPSEQTMPQDILKVLIDALVLKQTGTPAAPATPTTPAPGGVDIGGLLQTVIAALAGKPLPVPAGSDTSGGTATTTPPVLSTIDQIFGGQALAGKKTFLAVIAYVIVAILQAVGEVGPATGAGATATGQILTTIIGAFGVLGGASKLDRLTQALSLIAGKK